MEGVEGDGALYSSGISRIINSVCRGEVAMETPPYIPYTKVSMATGAFARHFGVASDTLHRSLLGCREDARDTAEAVLSLTHHVPMGTDSCGPL